jgi:hypothetical protein
MHLRLKHSHIWVVLAQRMMADLKLQSRAALSMQRAKQLVSGVTLLSGRQLRTNKADETLDGEAQDGEDKTACERNVEKC